MAKTPSPRVIAAKHILKTLVMDGTPEELSEQLTTLADSRVNEAKVEKVQEQVYKITGKLQERCRKIVHKFENPPPKKTGAKPSFTKKKSS